eukprot:1154699-Alexandrium_andersonii.AAC.1
MTCALRSATTSSRCGLRLIALTAGWPVRPGLARAWLGSMPYTGASLGSPTASRRSQRGASARRLPGASSRDGGRARL